MRIRIATLLIIVSVVALAGTGLAVFAWTDSSNRRLATLPDVKLLESPSFLLPDVVPFDVEALSLDDMLALPSAWRRAAFSIASPEKKSLLFREQLKRRLNSGEYSEDQAALISEAIAATSPQAYAVERTAGDEATCNDFIKRATALFNAEELPMFLGLVNSADRSILGSISPSATNSQNGTLSDAGQKALFAVSLLQPPPLCSCHSPSACSCGGPTSVEFCKLHAKNCLVCAGCGCFALYQCNGMCCDREFPNICS
jgi:hypothetical protein